MVTLEEKHSTRGRAHMLFELLQGRDRAGRLAGRARQASAGFVPFLQGVQIGMSHERGYRHVSRRVSFALLRRQAEAVARRVFRNDRPLGATCFILSGDSESAEPRARIRRPDPCFAASAERKKAAAIRWPHISRLGARPERFRCVRCGGRSEERRGAATDCFVAGYVHQLFSSRDRTRGAGSPGERGIPGERSRRRICAAAGRCTILGCSIAQKSTWSES